jgi:hypothetical protein
MAAEYALDGQPYTFPEAVLFDRFDGIFRTRWRKPAGGRLQRRNAVFVEIHRGQYNTGNYPFHETGD